MPRIAGVSRRMRTWPIFQRPRPRIVRSCVSGAPAKLLISFTFSDILALRLRQLLLRKRQLTSAQPRDLICRAQILQAVDRRLQDVVRIAGSLALGENVADTRGFQHRANGTPGDHAGAFHRRLEQDPSRPEVSEDIMRNRVTEQRHPEQILLRVLTALADRLGNLVRLAQANADMTVAVAH